MSKDNFCLFILSESSWLTWMSTFLSPLDPYISIATYDFKTMENIQVFPLNASVNQVILWITQNKFNQVIFLTNQSGLKRDLQIAKLLKKAGIKVICQSSKATNIGIDKIKMKQFLTQNGVNTPEYRIALSVDQALDYAKEISFPLILKVGKLSEGRKMALVNSNADISTYYYENAISEPVILEKFILGTEVSIIVYDNFGQPVVFPIISKPTTDYLFSGTNTRQRIYVSPNPKLQKITHKIQSLALRLAKLVNNKLFIGFDMVVGMDNKPYILEFNTRMTETIRMSIILTKTNIFERLLLMEPIEQDKDNSIPPHGFVADLPLETGTLDLIRNNKVKINSLSVISSARVTIFSEDYRKIQADLKKLNSL